MLMISFVMNMVEITLDHSAMIFYHRHPVIASLKRLEEEGKLSIHHAQSLNRELETLNETEGKMYERLREMVFAKPQQDLSLADHGDLVLLINHMKNKRDFFLTMDAARYASLAGHRRLDIRFPDRQFLKKIEGRLGISDIAKAGGKTAKKSKKASKNAKARRKGSKK